MVHMYVSVLCQATRDAICCITATDKTMIVVCISVLIKQCFEPCNKIKSKMKCLGDCVFTGP